MSYLTVCAQYRLSDGPLAFIWVNFLSLHTLSALQILGGLGTKRTLRGLKLGENLF